MEETKEWVPPETNRLKEILQEAYVINITDLSGDNWTSSQELLGYIKEKGLNYSDTKIGRELTKLGLTRESKKVDGKTLRVWWGIR